MSYNKAANEYCKCVFTDNLKERVLSVLLTERTRKDV